MKRTVLVSTSTFGTEDPAPLSRLRRAGFRVKLNPHGRRLTPEESRELLRDADGVIAGTERLTADVLSAAPRLKVLSRCGAGLDNVDLEAARRLGIVVRNAPAAPREAVAELALALILAALRRIPQSDGRLRRGEWKPVMGNLLRGKTVGIVGMGGVGRRLVELLEPFDVRILAVESRPDRAYLRLSGVRLVSLPALLASSDVVSLHVTLDAATRGMIGARALRRMRPQAVLVNTARGELVDERALVEALRRGRLGGAALDVYAKEPYRGPLTRLPNVILTPHMGSYAREARVRMESDAVENLLDAFRTVDRGGRS
jgi:D-3-phosphoglycerate dehydrogenase